ncbi:MAG TPA: DinB family protein [Vicinamibacterales bacterium]|nr:DinB family protein [Vicinamibacterales bacterium]
MTSLLRDLYGHQQWADAEHWRAIEAHPPAAADQALRTRLHHINLVQRAFQWLVGDRQSPLTITKPEDYPSLADLKSATREYHEEVARFLGGLAPHWLEETIEVPWFREPPLSLTREQALTQCAMHSQWHRGQNAARLRELGADPPAVDLIVWYWRGRPSAAWTA